MTIMAYEMDRIHASYPRIKCMRMIPCNCSECACSQSPHSYEYETLKRFISRGHTAIQCQNSCELVEVKGLIDDVEDSRLLRSEQSLIPSMSFSGQVHDVNVFVGQSPEGRRQPMPSKPKAKQQSKRST